jgi:hypothetical protein
MKLRIAIWAAAGALVSLLLALYFSAMPGARLGSLWILIDLSCPIALLRNHAMTYYSVTLANAATYAIAGTIVEAMRHHFKPAPMISAL